MHFAFQVEGRMEEACIFWRGACVRVCLSTQEPKSRPKPREEVRRRRRRDLFPLAGSPWRALPLLLVGAASTTEAGHTSSEIRKKMESSLCVLLTVRTRVSYSA